MGWEAADQRGSRHRGQSRSLRWSGPPASPSSNSGGCVSTRPSPTTDLWSGFPPGWEGITPSASPGDRWPCLEAFLLSRPGSVLSSSRWRPGMQPNSPRCPGQSPMTEDGLAPVSAGPRRAPYPPATPIQRTWGAWPWLPARPRKQTSGHCPGVLPILFLDFSRLSCFLLETCRLHVCAGKHRGVQPKTHTDPQVPARPAPQTCWSRDRLPCAPGPATGLWP